LALFWVLPLPVYSLDGEADANGSGFGNELERLITISTQLGELNSTLRNELDSSRKNSQELQLMLGKSKNELDALRAELELLRTASTGLLSTQDISQMDLKSLQAALMTAESSLTSLEQSFDAYRRTAELRIEKLEKGQSRYRTAFFIAAGVALGGITLGIVGLSK
jgi:predicted  nucleic acid-binding Zn-ribbon protein